MIPEEQSLRDGLSELSLGFLELVYGLIRSKSTNDLISRVKEYLEYSGKIAPQIFHLHICAIKCLLRTRFWVARHLLRTFC